MMAMKGLRYLATVCTMLLLVGACASPAAPSQPAKPATSVEKVSQDNAQAEKPAAEKPADKQAAAKPAEKAARPLEKIKIQIPTKQTFNVQLFLGIEKGIFKEEGLDPEIVVLKGDLAIPALLKGEVEYLNTFGRPLQAALLGEPVKLLMAETSKATWHYVLGPGITSAQQLKGKSVAIDMKGGTDHYASVVALKHLGLDPDKDVTFVVIPTYPDMLTALKSGAVSGAGLLPPVSNLAINAGMKEAIFTGDILDIPSDGLATTSKKMQENPDQVKRLMKAILKSQMYVRDHKDETIQFTMKEFNVDKDVATAAIEDQIRVWAYDGTVSEGALETFVDTMKASGGQLKDATVEQVKKGVDYALLKDVQKELGLSK